MGERGLPWEGPAAENGNISPQNWGPGNTGPDPPPLCSPIFVLLVCFYNLISAAVYSPIPIFPPNPQQSFPFCPTLSGVGWMWGSLHLSPWEAWVGLSVFLNLGAKPQYLSEQLEHLSFQIVYSRLFILLFWNKIYFMA